MARLLAATPRVFGAPKYLITDLGGEFRARIFARTVSRLGVRQRFASAASIHATARLERFWRTLKETASGRAGEGPRASPVSVAHLDPRNRRFPVLLNAA